MRLMSVKSAGNVMVAHRNGNEVLLKHWGPFIEMDLFQYRSYIMFQQYKHLYPFEGIKQAWISLNTPVLPRSILEKLEYHFIGDRDKALAKSNSRSKPHKYCRRRGYVSCGPYARDYEQ